MGYLKALAKALTDDGLVLPIPVRSFLEGKAQPFALDTRERLVDWCAEHGYSDGQRETLKALIGRITVRDRYHRSVISGSLRFNLDGGETGQVTDAECENARLRLAAGIRRRARSAKLAASPARASASPPAASSPRSPAPAAADAAVHPVAVNEEATESIGSLPLAASGGADLIERGVVVEMRRRTPEARLAPARSSATPVIRPERSPPRSASISVAVIRAVVEHVAVRRNALRMVAMHLKAGNHSAVAAERSQWIAEAVRLLTDDGHDRGAAERQVAATVDDRLIGVAPRAAWS